MKFNKIQIVSSKQNTNRKYSEGVLTVFNPHTTNSIKQTLPLIRCVRILQRMQNKPALLSLQLRQGRRNLRNKQE